jgi:hypothetical protein
VPTLHLRLRVRSDGTVFSVRRAERVWLQYNKANSKSDESISEPHRAEEQGSSVHHERESGATEARCHNATVPGKQNASPPLRRMQHKWQALVLRLQLSIRCISQRLSLCALRKRLQARLRATAR